MAVLATPIETVLVAAYQVGTTESGAPKLRQKSFQGIRANAADQDVYDVATALFSLQQYPLISVRRDNRVNLINE